MSLGIIDALSKGLGGYRKREAKGERRYIAFDDNFEEDVENGPGFIQNRRGPRLKNENTAQYDNSFRY